MISPSFNFKEFVQAIEDIEDKNYYTIMCMTEKELTVAERCFYRNRARGLENECCRKYACILKDFIDTVRYGTKPRETEGEDFELYCSVCKKLIAEKKIRPTNRCWFEEPYRIVKKK